MLSSSDCRVGRDRRPARARAGCARAARRAPARLHRVGRAPELRAAIAAIYDRTSPDDVVVVAAAEEGIFVAYHALLEPGRPRGRRDALLRVGAPGRALGGCRRDEWRRSLRRRLGARPRRARSGSCGPTRGSSTSTARTTRRGSLMSRRGARPRRRALRRARRVALLRRGLPRARARPGRPAARCVRSLRARAVARLDVEDLRAAGPAARLARLPRPRCAASAIVDLKHYTTICSSAPSELLSALALRHRERARRAQPRHRAREPAAARRVLRAARRRALVGAADGRRRSDSRACTAPTTRRHSASGSSPRRACSCFPGDVYDEPGHVRIGFGRRGMPRGPRAARALRRHAFLTGSRSSVDEPERKLSEQLSADTPCAARPRGSPGALGVPDRALVEPVDLRAGSDGSRGRRAGDAGSPGRPRRRRPFPRRSGIDREPADRGDPRAPVRRAPTVAVAQPLSPSTSTSTPRLGLALDRVDLLGDRAPPARRARRRERRDVLAPEQVDEVRHVRARRAAERDAHRAVASAVAARRAPQRARSRARRRAGSAPARPAPQP